MNEVPILAVENLCKYFEISRHKKLYAVDDVSFEIKKGKVFGILGESGCGKTTCGKTCMGMYDTTSGSVRFQGEEIHSMSKKKKFEFLRKVQMVFQDPYSSLDPHQRVYDIVAEGIKIHKLAKNKEEEKEKVFKLLELVGLNTEHAMRTPREFSGGQRQRIGIARALSVEPEMLFCDEPISALDVSIQAQILNLLIRLKREKQLTMLFIAHDVARVKYISDEIGIMYLGKMVEKIPANGLYQDAKHPYTKSLIAAMQIPDPEAMKEKEILKGEPPSQLKKVRGCCFCERCKYKVEKCDKEMPSAIRISENHWVACHLYDENGGRERDEI